MKKILLLALILTYSCKEDKSEKNKTPQAAVVEAKEYSRVEIENIFEDDSLSIRAIQVIGQDLAFAANKGIFGLYNSQTGEMKTGVLKDGDYTPEFRAVASTSTDVFVLSVGSPALLYKTGDSGQMELVYREDHEKAFYDSMIFWNDLEGIAMGDPTGNCLSVIITRNGGQTWEKLDCSELSEAAEGEAAFAASNSNIAVVDDKTWILSGGKKSRVYYSPDKGKTWEVFDTPLIQGSETTGGYSIDFYDENTGIIIGGDYTKPDDNSGNKAITSDGGKTWKLIAEGQEPGYKSSVRYVPNSHGENILATGFTGISYSIDGGEHWEQLSEESFFTLRFVNDSTAYAAGKGRISRLDFK
ncbi:WD40/YVTN/BNR-like repeat-containing protein [Salegentibacter sediminis]|uniref:WD40/YVTN/BNR-like repeat-containing protein n=1 Tax=Salegentibacter sediminis TaxID=1930251 RepID=UPI0009BE966D|nr:oxidoreductase [Salegentibacter sediminis]